MQEELTALEPELKKKSKETEELMQKLSVDKAKANEVSVVYMATVRGLKNDMIKFFLARSFHPLIPHLLPPGAYGSGARRSSG